MSTGREDDREAVRTRGPAFLPANELDWVLSPLRVQLEVARERAREGTLPGTVAENNFDVLLAYADDTQQDAAALWDWPSWIGLSWRRKLFDRYCRCIDEEEWQTYCRDGRIPWIFGDDRHEFDTHLDHCHFCRVQLRLVQLRLRAQDADGRLLPGDAVLKEFLGRQCASALVALYPPPGDPAQEVSRPVTVTTSPSPPATGSLQILQIDPLHDGPAPAVARFEVRTNTLSALQLRLCVVADFVTRRHGFRHQATVFPNDKHRDGLLPSDRRIWLSMPSTREEGRVLLRHVAWESAVSPRAVRARGAVRTRGGKSSSAQPDVSAPERPQALAWGTTVLEWPHD